MSRRLSLEAKDKREAIGGIKRGLQSMKSNAGKPAAVFFREFFAEKSINDKRAEGTRGPVKGSVSKSGWTDKRGTSSTRKRR